MPSQNRPGSDLEPLGVGVDALAEFCGGIAEPPSYFNDDTHDEEQDWQFLAGETQHCISEAPDPCKQPSPPSDLDDREGELEDPCRDGDGTWYVSSFKLKYRRTLNTTSIPSVRKSVTFAPEPQTHIIFDTSDSTDAPDVGRALASERPLACRIALDTFEHMASEKVCASGE